MGADYTTGGELEVPSSNRQPFAAMIEPQLNALYGFAMRLTGKKELAEDVLQDAVVKALENYNQLEDPLRFRSWMYRIVMNTFLNIHAAHKRRLEYIEDCPVEEYLEQLPQEGNPEMDYVRTKQREKILGTLMEMPIEYRTVLWLCDVEDLTLAEVAEINNIPQGTAASRLFRGRRMLYKKLCALGDATRAGES